MPAKKRRQAGEYRIRYSFAEDDVAEVSAIEAMVQALRQWAALASTDTAVSIDALERLREAARDIVHVRGQRFRHTLNPGGAKEKDVSLEELSDRQFYRRMKKARGTDTT